jgi:hypothetical protein
VCAPSLLMPLGVVLLSEVLLGGEHGTERPADTERALRRLVAMARTNPSLRRGKPASVGHHPGHQQLVSDEQKRLQARKENFPALV